MSGSPAGSRDERTVILCVSSSPTDRARVARLMSGRTTVLMFSDMNSVREVLFGEQGAPASPGAQAAADGRLIIDSDRQRVSWAGEVLPLTRIEREVLAALASRPLRVWSYRRLYERVWGADYIDDASAVRSTIKRLRAKLRDAGATIALESTRGVGFFLAETETDGRAPAMADGSGDPARAVQESRQEVVGPLSRSSGTFGEWPG